MPRKALYVLIIGLVIAMAVPAQARQDTYTLGISLPATTGVFFEAVSNGALGAASDAGAGVVVVTSDYDLDVELANVQDLIDQGVDALLFSPADPVGSLAAVELANEAGIPVFLMGDLVVAEDVEIDIAGAFTTDNALAGGLAGKAVCDALEESGAVLEIASVSDDETSIMAERSAGFAAYMTATCPTVAVTTVNVFDLSFDDALDTILDALDAADYDALVSEDDNTTLLAISANDIFRAKVLTIVGIGTHPDLSSSLEQGKLAATIIAEPQTLGEMSVDTALAYLNGETVDLTISAVLTTLSLDTIDAVRCTDPKKC